MGLLQNLGTIYNTGINAGWAFNKGPWEAGVGATYAYSRTRIDGGRGGVLSEEELQRSGYSAEAVRRHGRYQPIAMAPAIFGNARVAYRFGDGKPTLAQAVHYAGPRYIADVYVGDNAQQTLDDGARDTVPWRMQFRTTVLGPIQGSKASSIE